MVRKDLHLVREDRAASAASEVPVSVLVARIRENKEREQNYRVAPHQFTEHAYKHTHTFLNTFVRLTGVAISVVAENRMCSSFVGFST